MMKHGKRITDEKGRGGGNNTNLDKKKIEAIKRGRERRGKRREGKRQRRGGEEDEDEMERKR